MAWKFLSTYAIRRVLALPKNGYNNLGEGNINPFCTCRQHLAAAVYLGCLLFLGCESADLSESASNANNNISVEPLKSYRKVYEEVGSIEYEFLVRNSGDEPARIANIVSSCSCTVGTPSADVIPPHGSVTFRVVYNVVSQFGELAQRKILIKTDGPKNQEIVCQVGGHRERRYNLVPEAIDFGRQMSGQETSSEIVIEAFGQDNNLDFERATIDNPFVAVGLIETTPSDSGSRHRVRVQLQENAPIGDLKAAIFVPSKQRKGVGPQILVRAKVCGPLSVNPTIAFFGVLVKDSQPLTLKVQLKPFAPEGETSETPLRISETKIEGLPEGVTAEIAADDPGTISLIADPTVLSIGALDKKVIVSCLFDNHLHRIDLGLRALVATSEVK